MSLPLTTFFMYYNQIEYLDALEQTKKFEVSMFPFQSKEDRRSVFTSYKNVVSDFRTKKEKVVDSWKSLRKRYHAKRNGAR